MRKFKLIKAYPNSPELGTILNEKLLEPSADKFYYAGYWFNPQSFSEFWEEIIEKDYEIICFRRKWDNNVTVTPYGKKRGWLAVEDISVFTEDELLHNKNFEIYIVKRLSDGEIFTIGDKVRITKLQCDGSFIIDRFYFDCNNDKLLCNGKSSGNGHVSITKIEKVKQPLFITEDGKEIFKGDKFWFADKYKFSEGTACDSDIRPTLKHFSTKEAAENYVVCNKPCLSFHDVSKIAIESWFRLPYPIKKALKELVRKKL